MTTKDLVHLYTLHRLHRASHTSYRRSGLCDFIEEKLQSERQPKPRGVLSRVRRMLTLTGDKP